MKKLLSVLLAAALCLALVPALAEEPAAPDLSGLFFTPEQTLAMSNAMNMGRYVTVDGVIYGRTWGNKLSRFTPGTRSGKATADSAEILCSDIVPLWLCEMDGFVYCCLDPQGADRDMILRTEVATGEVTPVYEGVSAYLQARGGVLYFTDENNAFCSVPAQGGEKTVLVDRAVYYPYFLTDDLLYFQDDGDAERGHILQLSTGAEVTVTDRRAYTAVLAGDMLYYTFAEDGGEDLRLGRVNLKTLENEHCGYFCGNSFFLDGGEIWFPDDTHMTPDEAMARESNVKNYKNTRLSYLYSDGSFYVRYGWKSGTSTISRMLLMACGSTKAETGKELKLK